MAYLFLNFATFSKTGTNWAQDFYNKPLKEQYKVLTLRYPQLKQVEYEKFFQVCFPIGSEKKFYISMPNFIREKSPENDEQLNKSLNSGEHFNNIVIRSTRDYYSENILPKGFEIILIGNVKINSNGGEFKVKGFELIDGLVFKHGETEINATTMLTFDGRPQNFPELYIPLLTYDFMGNLCTSSYTVPDPAVPLKIYNDWKEYIKFRRYYLDKQGEDLIEFDACEAIKCHIIPQHDYRMDPEKYDEYILDDLDGIKKDEQIIVTKQFDNSEPFELVKVIINKYKKELFDDTLKGKGEMPVYEQKLRRFTRSEISLQSGDGKQVNVDERYRFFHKDIQPDYSELELKFTNELKDAYKEIDERFAAVLKQKVAEYIRDKTKDLTDKAETRLSDYKTGLNNRLEQDADENKDDAIRRSYAIQIKQIEETIKKQIVNMEKEYKAKIDSIKGKKDIDTEAVKKLEQQHDDKRKVFNDNLAQQKDSVSLIAFYERRNYRLVSQKEAELKAETEAELRRNQKERLREIQTEQEHQIREEKEEAKRKYTEKLEADKAFLKDTKTRRCYYIYFKLQPDDTSDKINDEIKKVVPKYFKLDRNAEKVKIDRQNKSLNNLFSGYVKNPFLATYLFAPDKLGDIVTDIPELEYFSQRLNDKQREAVRKAVASESIFLLQGPPGTGKTEVIAEIAAQLAKRGKRILISSETHKAIDNVFERLPKIPEIRPLRLIPSQSRKDPSPYSTERMVDNFYINISNSIKKELKKFDHFNEDKEKFGEEYKSLRIDHEKLNKEKSRIDDIQITLDRTKRERDDLDQKLDAENEKLRLILEEKETLFHRMKKIGSLNLSTGDEYEKKIIETFIKLLHPHQMLNQNFDTLVFIHKTNIPELKEEIALLSGNPELIHLEAKRIDIKEKMNKLRDPDTDNVFTGKESDYRMLQENFIDLGKQVNNLKNASNFDLSELSIAKIINKTALEQNAFTSFPNILAEIKTKLVDWINESKNFTGTEYDEKSRSYNTQKNIVDDCKKQIRNKDKELQGKKEDSGYEDYHVIESELKRKIAGFFKRFDIMKTYEDIATALDIIKDEWNELERNFKVKENENKEKIPVYRRISKFLKELNNDNSIESDRREYTKKLFEKANIFGLTCTSRENFRPDQIEAFQKYALDGLNVKEQGIDVVIIDEVSKSSLLDLLIPILYGKTVILVGDHRQLPPMYDLSHMRKDDFEGLDPDIIDLDKNREFTKLYEECFFKKLFESVPERLRVMLTKQYRCHEDIMRVFNHFYWNSEGHGSLEIGTPNQNDQKQHGLLIKNKNGKSIIEPGKHIYFIDCGDSYENFGDSTSATNEKEAQVITRLVRDIDNVYGNGGFRNKFTVEKDRDIDERMSMGIISTYGDQVKLIKNKLQIKKTPLKNICTRYEERFIISTVDDFQGDERDIIFVSMVRNPRSKKSWATQAEFLKKFERINVAFSRARRLLIIVGAKEFLSEAVINLPDMGGNMFLDKKAHPVYWEIINTISWHGMVHKAADIVGEDK